MRRLQQLTSIIVAFFLLANLGFAAGPAHVKTDEEKKKEAEEKAQARESLPSDVRRLLEKVEELNEEITEYSDEYLRDYSSGDFSKVDRLRKSRDKYYEDLQKKVERHRKPFEKKVEEIEAQIEKLFDLQANAKDKARAERYAKEREEITEERYAVRESTMLLNNLVGELREVHEAQPSISKHSALGRKAPRLRLEAGEEKTDLETLGKDSWLFVFMWTTENTSGFSKHVYSDKTYSRILPIKIVGINADRSSKTKEEAAQMMADNKWPNTFAYGDRILRSFKVDRAPAAVLIDPKGIIRQVYTSDPSSRVFPEHLAYFKKLDGPPPEAPKSSESESETKKPAKRNPFARRPPPNLGKK
jgi:hypothetical protein